MLKLTGALVILSAPVLFSLCRYRAELKQEQLLAAFSEMLALSAGQIRSEHTALPELSARMERQAPAEMRSFWREVGAALRKGDDDFEAVWARALSDAEVTPFAQQILRAYPQTLRSYDTERIARELLRMREELEQCRAAACHTFRRDFKMHTGIQVSAALLLMILLF